MKWQPIETAPKDGRYVILWLGEPWNMFVKARWNEVLWQADVDFDDFYGDGDEICGIGSGVPTHWMLPLPPPPDITEN